MNRVLVDINVVLDVLLAREPHAPSSTACVAVVESGKVEGFLSGHAVTTIACLVGRARGALEARKAVHDLCAIFAIAPVDERVIRRAIALSLADFEDAVTAAAAEACGCTAILTRDTAGFRESPVLAQEPTLWLALLAERIQDSPADEVHEPRVGDPPPRRQRRRRAKREV